MHQMELKSLENMKCFYCYIYIYTLLIFFLYYFIFYINTLISFNDIAELIFDFCLLLRYVVVTVVHDYNHVNCYKLPDYLDYSWIEKEKEMILKN